MPEEMRPVGMDLNRLTEEYVKSQDHLKAATKRQEELKQMLLKRVEALGEPDDKGHVWLPTGEWLLKKERRVSEVFDQSAAEEWARENDLWDSCSVEIPAHREFSADRMLALAFERPDLEPTIKKFWGQKETWAFAAPKPHKDYDY